MVVFFEKEMILFDILDVLEIKQKNIKIKNKSRNFNALSFRFKAETHLITENTNISLSENSAVYVPAGLDYFRDSVVDELIVIHFNMPDYQTQNIEFFISENPDILAGLFREILDCWNKKEIGYKYRASAVFYKILAECYLQNFRAFSAESKIKNSVDYILKNYKNNEISIKEIAGCSYMSEVYFRKIFKEEYGVSPRKYITTLRIQYACHLISTGYYSLKEIVYMSGYSDYKYFSSVFKRIIGVSPSDYIYSYE